VTVPDQVKTPPPFGGTSDAWVRALSASLAGLAPAARGIARTARRRPFLCVITPVFDPARASVELLIEDLMRQTLGDFVHVMVSNGPSPEVAAFVARVRAGDLGGGTPDERFVYEELPVRETPDAVSLLVDLGRRRRHAVGTHAADRYVFLDADAEILDERYCARLYVAHVLSRRDLILTMVRYYDRVLPEFPIGLGRIDMANFTFSAAIAREHLYPNDHDPSFGLANDYRFWAAISAGRTPLVLDAICVRKDGHKGYVRLTDRFIGEALAGQGPGANLIPLFGNSFDQNDIDGVARVLESHLVGPGAQAKELERRVARLLGFEHAVSTSTATNAFWLLARALDLDGSTEVIVPNIHFYGVTNVLRLLEVPYRVADVGPGVPNISPDAMAACLTPRTRAVVVLDYGGWPADVPGMRRALAAAGRSDVLLIADAANSLLTRVAGKYWAHSYDHAFVSFDMNKIAVTGDGGMVLTDDATVSERVRRLAFHGIEDEVLTGFERARRGAGGGPMWWEVRIGEPGLNLLMNDIAGSLGLTQLAKAEGFLAKRQAVRDVYLERLAPLAEAGTVELPPTSPSVSGDLYMFWIKLADRATRDALARSLLEQGVYTSVKYQPVDASAGTPNAHDFWARALCLPLHQNLEPVFADYVMSQVVGFLGGASRPARGALDRVKGAG
jgi:aminotransferase